MDLYSSILLLLLSIFSKEAYSSIIWHMANPTIVFGGDVVLFCNASIVENCCTKTATWMKDFDVIVHHGSSADSSKYTEKQHSDGFSLVIKRFEKDDINHQYTCLYDFFSYSAVLTINKNNYKYMPKENETRSNITMSDNLIFADIMFDIIYPSPDCVLVVNGDKMATNVTVSNKILTRLYYKLRLRLVCEFLKSVCIDSIAINCTVGREDVQYVDHKNTSFCPDVTTNYDSSNESDSLQTTVLIITFICVITFCIAVFTCFVKWRRGKNRKQNYKSVEGCKPVNSRSRILRSPCYMTEESELISLITVQVDLDTNIEETSENIQEQDISTTCTARIRTYADQMLTELIPYIKSKFKKFKLIIETFESRLEDRESLYAAWYVNTSQNINPTRYPPSLKDTKSTSRYTTPPAQKMKDVKLILCYAILHDSDYIQRLATDTGINLARHRSEFTEFKGYAYSSELAKKYGRSNKAWATCPAQKDVTKMVQCAILFDKAYIQILVTNTRIQCARLLPTSQREIKSSSESDHQRTNSQTMDKSYHHAVPQHADFQIQIDIHISEVNGMNYAADATCVTCPAQNEKDVIKLINYAKRHDTIYMHILVTNERINYVRQLYSKTKENVV